MVGWGITFIIIGIGAFILPMIEMQFILITLANNLFGSETVTAIVFIGVGVALIIIGAARSGGGAAVDQGAQE